MNKVFHIGICMGFIGLSIAKTAAQSSPLHPAFDIPKVIPPTGTAAAFARYGEIPVDISTGVPGIEIPLYTVTSRKLSVPLSLAYHASGIKVDDVATSAGLGWVLKGTGVVNRTILGLPDELPLPQIGQGYYGGKVTYASAEAYQQAVANCPSTRAARVALGTDLHKDLKYRDSKSDRFTFLLPAGSGGTFRYDFTSGSCVVVPYRPVKIVKGFEQYGTPYNRITLFRITDENGIVYEFGRAEKNNIYNCGDCHNGGDNVSWYITSIRTPDGGDVIEYQYKTAAVNKFSLRNYSHTYSQGVISNSCPGGIQGEYMYCAVQSAGSQSSQYVDTNEPLLEKIISATTIVEFIYADDRIDWADAKYRLAAIKIYNRPDHSLVKEIVLNNDAYFGSTANSRRLKLNSVVFKGHDSRVESTYTFNYEGLELPPYGSFSQDFWGYYNGQSANTGLVPREFINPVMPVYGSVYAGIRKPDHNYARACMLKEIIYPTGGKTSFEFEPNHAPQMMQGISAGNVGGFRVKSIKSYTHVSDPVPVSLKSYSYALPDFPHYIGSPLFSHSLEYDWDYGMCASIIVGPPPLRHVTQSSSFSSLSFSNGAPVVYTRVVEYDGTETSNKGKTEYYFSTGDDPRPEPWTNIYGPFWYDNGTYEPKLILKKVFKNVNDGYIPVSSIENTYTAFHDLTYSTGVHAVKTSYDIMPGNDSYVEDGYLFGSCCPNCPPRYIFHFSYKNCVAATKVSLLTQTKESHFKPDGTPGLSTTTGYFYGNPSHLQPTAKKVVTSWGEELKADFKYPSDDPYLYPNYYMVQANMLTPVLEQKNFRGNEFLSSVTTSYHVLPGTTNVLIAPGSIQSKTGDGPPETRIAFHGYDTKGNLLQASRAADVMETYLYGYNASLPVAKLTGTTYAVASGYITQSVLDNPPGEAALRDHLSNLRNIPGAFVTTYTYNPAVGMTSETDANGRTIYYEYDVFGRLALVKDRDNNVLKKICYNYAGQPEYCFGNTSPAWENTATPVRCKEVNNQYTGELEQEQQDVNPGSSTYNQTQWVVIGTNTTTCPVPACSPLCSGEDKKCINGYCETGSKICTSSVRINPTTWLTTYHYQWSDGSTSQNYQSYGAPCLILEP